MTVPDWLKLRNGSLKPGLSPHSVFVMFGGRPQYRLDVRPAGGAFTCDITQTVNGHRFDSAAKYAGESEAFAGGLDTVRAALGW